MRALLIATFLLSFAAASGEDLNSRAHPLRLPLDGQRSQHFAGRQESVWSKDVVLGDRLGKWLGVRAGHLDLFNEPLFDDGTAPEPSEPTIAGTIRKDAAEIQLRWRPDE